MAEESATPATRAERPAAAPAKTYPRAPEHLVYLAPLLGWLVPGAGHLLQRCWARGALLMASVSATFFIGLAMQGKVYAFNTGDILEILGFFGNLGAGGLYFFTRFMDEGQGAIHRATADYGTKFIIVAGLLNVIAAVDAYQIAIGKKPGEQPQPEARTSGRTLAAVAAGAALLLAARLLLSRLPWTLELSHLTAAVVFAALASTVFGVTHRDSARGMLRYGLYCFTLFVVGVFLAGWLMWLIRR
jgi:hypothetical protein